MQQDFSFGVCIGARFADVVIIVVVANVNFGVVVVNVLI